MRRSASNLARGFTLVELLITITIIGILMTFSVGAVFLAQETARTERTGGIIQKLHNVIIDRWESYRTRRVILVVANNPTNRLNAIREVMRMEMPDRYEDLVFVPAFVDANLPLRAAYVRRINAARLKYNTANSTTYANHTAFISNVLDNTTNQNEAAECLYLLISASMSADERAEFRDKEYADTNNNFMPEFIDGWGNPIRFLRWAPGVVSDVQIHEPVDYHDPFDQYGLQIGAANQSGPADDINKNPPPQAGSEPAPLTATGIQEWGYAILPYIYSAGPDKEYGIHQLLFDTPASTLPAALNLLAKNRNPFSRYDPGSGTYAWRGDPVPVGGDTVNLDNIHNHNPLGLK